MALPVKKAAELAKDMASKGLIGSISMAKPEDKPEDMSEDEPKEDMDGIEAICADMDHLCPGMGKLMMELCERLQSQDKEQDEEDMRE